MIVLSISHSSVIWANNYRLMLLWNISFIQSLVQGWSGDWQNNLANLPIETPSSLPIFPPQLRVSQQTNQAFWNHSNSTFHVLSQEKHSLWISPNLDSNSLPVLGG
jgi:hypothetical protein